MVWIKHSKLAYKEKPTSEDMRKISYDIKNMNSVKIDYKILGEVLEIGHSVLLAKYKNNSESILEENIEFLECIALDIDSKENKITLFEMQALIFKKFGVLPVLAYQTFSDVDFTKFRLIYRFEQAVDVEVYRKFYEALQWKLKKYLDQATKNANRIWAGTNKKVIYNEKDIAFNFPILIKLINSHKAALERKNKKTIIKKQEGYIEFKDEDYIKPEYKEEVLKYIIDNTDLLAFIQKHFGGNFKEKTNQYISSCCLPCHKGDRSNKEAFVIFKNSKTYRCFSHCGTGNIFTIAKIVYGIDNFSQLAFKLADEFGIVIDESCIRRIKHNGKYNKNGADK